MRKWYSYLAFVDHRFSRAARMELDSSFAGCRVEPCGSSGGTRLFNVELGDADAAGRLNACTFVDFAFRVDVSLTGYDNARICAAIASLSEARAGGPIRLEVKNAGARLGMSAKSMEVALGQELERRGIAVDLGSPSTVFYAVFLRGSVIIGHATAGSMPRGSMDAFRFADSSAAGISRAGHKIREAVEFFGIDMSDVKSALDIGAAPGGWTEFLLGRGATVLAVDRASLDYAKLAALGKKILVLVDDDDERKAESAALSGLRGVDVGSLRDADGFGGYDIVHVMANLHDDELRAELSKFGRFDMLAIDINESPAEAASVAAALSEELVRGAPILITLKLTTMSIRKHMRDVEDALSDSYSSIRFKKLPHNRLEITVCGVNRPSRPSGAHPLPIHTI